MKVYLIYVIWDKTGRVVNHYVNGVFMSRASAERSVAKWTADEPDSARLRIVEMGVIG